jgi:hypothetical protein
MQNCISINKKLWKVIGRMTEAGAGPSIKERKITKKKKWLEMWLKL